MKVSAVFDTDVLKLAPSPPASSEATPGHWRSLGTALGTLASLARQLGVRLAFETHMGQLTDNLASCRRFLDMAPEDCVGLTLDFSNLSFAGERTDAVVHVLGNRTFHTHLKNGFIDAGGGWQFRALDKGLTDYTQVLSLLGRASYDGYLSLECLGEDARRDPHEAATRDLKILRRLLHQNGLRSTPPGGSNGDDDAR